MFPSYVELISIGTSYEGRDIHAIRMGARDQDGDSSKSEKRKTILITGGIHAREWISTSSVNYLIWSLTTAYGKEPLITKLLQDFDVVLVPVVNPDGYEYTWSADRLWRKSRQQTGLRICRGLDLDHAFGYAWDAVRHQADPCSESYGGDKPFQAVEAAKLADWAQNETDRHGVKFVGLLDLHSYSQQILFPYSYSCAVDPPNRENLEELAVGLAKAIRLSSGEVYGVESACEGAVLRNGGGDEVPRVEAGGGSFIDWFYRTYILLACGTAFDGIADVLLLQMRWARTSATRSS
jgi:extracellular matrix protein 14